MNKIISVVPPRQGWWYKDGIDMPGSSEEDTDNIWENYAIKRWYIPNQKKVREQHYSLVKKLEEIGIGVVSIPLNENSWLLDSAVFVRDAFVSNQVDRILLSKFRRNDRVPQALWIWKALQEKIEKIGLSREIIVPPEKDGLYLEGWEFRYIRWSWILFAGFNTDQTSSRNSYSGVNWTREQLWVQPENVILVEAKWFHLDTVMWVITDRDERVVACIFCKELISNYSEVKVACVSRWIKCIEVDNKFWIYSPMAGNQWALWTVNTLNIGNALISWWRFDSKTEDKIATLGVRRLIVDISEFWNAWGWVHCLTNQI